MGFFKFWRPHMTATLGQFPANFRFSGALVMSLNIFYKILIYITPISNAAFLDNVHFPF